MVPRTTVAELVSVLEILVNIGASGVGRLALAPMLNERGKLIGDFTLNRLAEDKFLLVGALVLVVGAAGRAAATARTARSSFSALTQKNGR